MNGDDRYRCRAPHVIYESFDDEVVIVDLESGAYYGLDQVGADVWATIMEGLSIDEVVEAVTERYTGERSGIERGVRSFIGKLLAGTLIVPVASGTPAPVPADPSARHHAASDRAFSEPHLDHYTDMKDLLLLDPIHEVDESGWPKGRPDEPGK